MLARDSGTTIAYWLSGENIPITASQGTFGAVALTPKNLGALTVLSHQLVRQVDAVAEQVVMFELAAAMAAAFDRAALNGSGASGEPLGVLNMTGIGSVSGTNLGHAGLVEFQGDLIDAEVEAGANSSGYLTTATVAKLLKGRYIGAGAVPLWSGNLWDGEIEGLSAAATKQMPAATMLFGDFSQVVIGEWGQLTLDLNPYENFAVGKISVRAWYTADIAVRHPAAFSVAKTIT